MNALRLVLLGSVCGAAALVLAACDNGPSAVAHKQSSGTQMASNAGTDGYPSRASGDSSAYDQPREDHRKDPVKLVAGRPIWSASRRFSAQENAERAFERNGKDFGAGSLDAFVDKAHAFVEHPPKGTLTLTRRNGDTLFYDPKGNVFAVASKDGAPRTMFKPDDGMAYWEQQKAREEKAQTARRNRRGSDDEA
jgi:pyocin large subunit-like protein